ncbi:hypothetical protein [Pseudodesulfovibrio sediminis]|uniref:Uncharacterized protein n=1 Tax=Pseudodesulfovibrio sediminis TaxID=2810563 RepID=A0ABM7P7C7_9BACT|nr:hypothetical protein [Pseudodesulfovibrio sediminis]BCS88838.1 hypothetical protein PSDVSF_20800 [Pseudodesulfovibrio sediminis]
MRPLLGFLFKREVVLVAFLLIKGVAAMLNGLQNNTTEAWGMGILMLLTYSVIVWFAYKRQRISIWAISILMIYDAAGAVIGGWQHFNTAPAVGVIGLIVGLYITFGAMVIFSGRHQSV